MKDLFNHLLDELNVNKYEFTVVDSNFYHRLSKDNGNLSLILGESYMAGEWKSDDLASFFRKVVDKDSNKLLSHIVKKHPLQTSRLFLKLLNHDIKYCINDILFNDQSIILSKRVGEKHYDIPDILYENMLDSQRQYTCGYWKPGVKTLEEAQRNKINLIIDKLQIPDDNTEMNILDIGCGWGGLTHAISQRYPKCNIDGISISKEQIKYANNKYKNVNLRYIFCDYRDLVKKNKKYDRIVSVGMFEHVGIKNFDTFFNVCETILRTDGIFLLHTITKPKQSKYIFGMNNHLGDPWMTKYIFPGGSIPLPESILKSAQNNNLMYHHIQNLSISYAKTLNAWYKNFTSNWDKIRKSNPDFFTDEFNKMWEFYLLSCMVIFEKKKMQLTQFVFTKKKYKGMYIFVEK